MVFGEEEFVVEVAHVVLHVFEGVLVEVVVERLVFVVHSNYKSIY